MDERSDKVVQLRKQIRVPRAALTDTRWSIAAALINKTVPRDVEMLDTISGRQPQPKKIYKKRENYYVKHRDVRPSTSPTQEDSA